MYNYDVKFEDLLGKVLVSIENRDDEYLIFTTKDGKEYMLYHSQDCCESVTIEDICGNLNDLLNMPILLAEEVIQRDENPLNANIPHPEWQDSFTWTFYKLSTNKGSVTIRWYGESNGYYSEEVSFVLK